MVKKYLSFLIFIIGSSLSAQNFVKDFYSVKDFVSMDDKSFFIADDGVLGHELWKTDGTKGGTLLVKDINPLTSSNPYSLFIFKGEIYFSANDGVLGHELWKTDGTESGTVMVKNIHKSFGQGSNPSNFTIFNNELYFTATENYINGNFQIWKTDGTETGTVKVFDNGPYAISGLITANNKLYVLMGNIFEFDLNSQTISQVSIDEYSVFQNIKVINDELYFITADSYNRRHIKFYKLGNSNIPVLLQEFEEPLYGDIDIHNITLAGNNVYFSITTDFNSGSDTDVLWKTDGTFEGTAPIKTFGWDRHISRSNISDFIEYKNELYFNSGSKNNYRLWKSNGTESGTVQSISTDNISSLIDFLVFDDLLYFSKDNVLWSTDGTSENTKKISDLKIVSNTSDDLFNIGESQSTIFFESIYQDKKALYTINSSPILEIKKGNPLVNGKDKIYLESKIDSVEVVKLQITNRGNGDLVFSKIEVVGKDFYLNGKQLSFSNGKEIVLDFPQTLKTNELVYLDIIFFPSDEGLKKGNLKLISNDVENPTFTIELSGYSENVIGESPSNPISLDKQIIFNSSNDTIKIDKNEIFENSPINYLVGTLNVLNDADNYIYEFVQGENDSDNSSFTIENNTLKTNSLFDYEIKNTYNIKFKAINTITNEIVEENIVISILDISEEVQLEDCESDYVDLTFGLNDIEFIDNQNLVAIGNHGIIIKSGDAGKSWRKILSKPYSNLDNLQFTSNTTGYAIGDKILKTEDAGESWFPLELTKITNTYNSPRNLYFINDNVGYVFGDDGKILKTTNGGKYWKSYNYGNNKLYSGYFFDEAKGFICGASKTLIRTNNGGISWERIDLSIAQLRFNTVFTNIYFVNEQLGFITSDYGHIIKTIDGGITWNLVSKLEYDISIDDIIFLDENNGYVLTSIYLYETIDGGANWTRSQKDDAYESLKGFDVTSDGGEKWMVGHGASCCIGNNTGSVIYKQASNSPWETISYLGVDSQGFSEVYFNESKGLVFSQFSSGKTLDGGITWQQIYPPETNIIQVEVENDIVYLLGQDNIYKSTDFGDTWDILSASIYFRKLYFVNSLIIYAIAQERGVFKSVDGGLTWLETGSSMPFGISFYFINEDVGFVGGVEGMYKTVNGGDDWTQVMLEPEAEYQPVIFSINFFNDSIGLAGSSTGLLKTIDGGNTWVRMNKDLGGEVKFIHSNSELEWYIVTSGRLLSTKDGGDTWKTEFYGEDVDNVFFADEKVYLVGYRHFVEVSTKNPPMKTSPIEGNQNTLVNVKELYSVSNEEGTNYRWNVSGDNTISYSDNNAEVVWNSSGNYTISVTPFNSCGEGLIREISVIVNEDDIENPVIIGDTDVNEYSKDNLYSVNINSNSRYNWFVKGSQNINKDNNNLIVDWGENGIGKVEVIETHSATGNRKKAELSVTINPAPLDGKIFSIETIGETCPDKNNAKIIISASKSSNYIATINNIDYDFSKDLVINDLSPNKYELCISIPLMSSTQCYILELQKSTSITGKSSVNSGKVSIDISEGTAPYNISKNGVTQFYTNATSFSVDAIYGDLIEVTTSKSCEGKLTKKIDLMDQVIGLPNPTTGNFEIALPISLIEVKIDLYTIQSQLISTSRYKVINGRVSLSLEDQPNGIYFIKVYLDEPVSLKIVKQ
jgi:ELWxxDGT repeat protein